MEYFDVADADGAAGAVAVAERPGSRQGRAKRCSFSPEYKRQMVAG